MSTPTFVVGTGRCGSTMLSNMLREHPKVLSLSEFYGCMVDYRMRLSETFDPEPMDGQRFWETVSVITPYTEFIYRHRVPCDEWLYPYETHTARFSSRTGVPTILITTLPHLTGEHDKLFGQLQATVSTWPNAKKSVHYNRLFGWLTAHFNKQLWIERSGAGLLMLEDFLAIFPTARFIHIARDGRDAAISMQSHLGMRLYFVMGMLAQYLGLDPIMDEDRTLADRVPTELHKFMPESFDADAFREFRVPISICAGFWTQQVVPGLAVLSDLSPDRLLTLRYEDILSAPKDQLDTLASFLGEEFVDEDWSARCAATVRPPRSSWRDLPEQEARALTEACRPGFELLRQAGVEYEF